MNKFIKAFSVTIEGEYRHYRNKEIYKVLATCSDDTSDENYVVYINKKILNILLLKRNNKIIDDIQFAEFCGNIKCIELDKFIKNHTYKSFFGRKTNLNIIAKVQHTENKKDYILYHETSNIVYKSCRTYIKQKEPIWIRPKEIFEAYVDKDKDIKRFTILEPKVKEE